MFLWFWSPTGAQNSLDKQQNSQREGFVCLFCPRERPIDNQATSSRGLILPIGPDFFGFLPQQKVRESGFEFRPADRKHPRAVPRARAAEAGSAPAQPPAKLRGAPSSPPPARAAPLPQLPALPVPGDPALPDAVASCSPNPGPWARSAALRCNPSASFGAAAASPAGLCRQLSRWLRAARQRRRAAGRAADEWAAHGLCPRSGPCCFIAPTSPPPAAGGGPGEERVAPASQEQRRFGMRGCSGAPNTLPRARDPATWTRGLINVRRPGMDGPRQRLGWVAVSPPPPVLLPLPQLLFSDFVRFRSDLFLVWFAPHPSNRACLSRFPPLASVIWYALRIPHFGPL